MMATSTIIISFQPTKLKLFRSKKKSLLVIDGNCINGSLNRIRPGNKALIHVRPSTILPLSILEYDDGLECLASELLLDEELRPHMNKGCWVEVDSTQRLVIQAHANMERNRRGDRLVECAELLTVQTLDDETYLPINKDNEYNEYILSEEDSSNDTINVKTERHKIFAHWLIDTYGKEYLSRGTGVIDVAGGNGMISQTLTELGIRSTLLDPNPRHDTTNKFNHRYEEDGTNSDDDNDTSADRPSSLFGVIPYPLNGDGSDLTSREDNNIGDTINNCSLLCGLHPDQATEPIVELALRLNVPFAILPCCVMPSLFPNRFQKRYNNDPVRSYSAFCQYLLDMAPSHEEFEVDYLPFVGRNKVIYRRRIM